MKKLKIRMIAVVVFIVILAGIAGAIFSENRSVVGAKDSRVKRFASVQVKKGDSLWSIAKERMGDDYHSIDDYIEEVCETNHIYDEKITENMYLVVPYYTDL